MEMENELRGYYSELATGINQMIPVEWSEVYFLGEVGRGRTSFGCIFYFEDKQDGIWTRAHEAISYGMSQNEYFKKIYELIDLVTKIYDCFIANDQQGWEQMTFHLTSTGKFDVTFDYDLNDYFYADAGPMAREAIWAYETFGQEQEEGNVFWSYLNEYLERKKQFELEKA